MSVLFFKVLRLLRNKLLRYQQRWFWDGYGWGQGPKHESPGAGVGAAQHSSYLATTSPNQTAPGPWLLGFSLAVHLGWGHGLRAPCKCWPLMPQDPLTVMAGPLPSLLPGCVCFQLTSAISTFSLHDLTSQFQPLSQL